VSLVNGDLFDELDEETTAALLMWEAGSLTDEELASYLFLVGINPLSVFGHGMLDKALERILA
jgi:hypothetical protein